MCLGCVMLTDGDKCKKPVPAVDWVWELWANHTKPFAPPQETCPTKPTPTPHLIFSLPTDLASASR
jgi:hypothetical protein